MQRIIKIIFLLYFQIVLKFYKVYTVFLLVQPIYEHILH